VIHGEEDDVVPLRDVLDWRDLRRFRGRCARRGHFFHGNLIELARIVHNTVLVQRLSMLSLKGVHKRYGSNEVVRGMDLELRPESATGCWVPMGLAKPPPCAWHSG
jgi:hypothetical protein